MARQEVNIGVEGNDGTGDSIRESFRKTNENFQELYAVFGQGGTIRFTSLEDTPSELAPNTVALVNDAGTSVQLATLASNSALDENATDTITFNFDQPGKLIISTAFTKLADDLSPSLGGTLYANNKGIAGVAITDAAASQFLSDHGVSVSIDDLVITKGYADRRYITSANVGLPIRVEEEPAGVSQYTLTVGRYNANRVEINGHGYDSGINGTGYVFQAEDTDPTNLVSGTTYYIRFFDENNFTLHTTEAGAASEDAAVALATQVLVTGTIAADDTHTLTDAAYDVNLSGNFLDNVAIPRKSVTRRQGDTMTGALYLHDHPGELAGEGAPNGEEDLQAATKYYVDNTSYSSPTNLFVSTKGDDKMAGVPSGKEGTSLTYAYKTINAAAARANDIIRTSEAEPGPYFQQVTKENGGSFAAVTTAEIDNPFNDGAVARTLMEANRDFFIKEVSGFLAFTYPDFVYDIDICERDTGLVLDAIAFDINRGLNANYLTRQAAEKYYSNSSGRKAITSQLTETVAGFDFLKELATAALQNELYLSKEVDDITRASPAVVTTTTNHGFVNKNQVTFNNVGGMTDLEDTTAYVKVISDQTFELFSDETFETPIDTSGFDGYTSGAQVGIIYQTIERQDLNQPQANATARNAIRSKFDLFETIITDGIDSGADIVYGSTYKTVLDNGSATNVDQGDPDNTDILPGKVMVGEISGAKGQIVSLTVNDGTENNNDTVQMHLLSAKDFIVGEPVRYGNFVKKKQVTIFIESGFYEEDYPIRLANNVSVKGDEFRRVIIRPKDRVSQSPFADTYFFRDQTFDGLTLASAGQQFFNQNGDAQGYFGRHYLTDPTSVKNVGPAVTNAGAFTKASAILKRNKEFIQEEVIEFITATYPAFTYNEAKCRRDTGLIVDALIKDLVVGGEENVLEAQGEYYSNYIAQYDTDGGFAGQETETEAAIQYIATLASSLLIGNSPSPVRGSIQPDLTLPDGETGTVTITGNLVDKVTFAFNAGYNPPKRNDEMDVFLMSDATIVRNVTVQGHGGFMCVLDPEGQVLTKSPYIQTASSFSKSTDTKRFAGGMYVDAFVGNIPAYIPQTIDPGAELGGSQNGKIDNFTLWIRSNAGEGLFIRPPELPCPFYVEGRRYQVNAISDYDSGNGWCKIYLDAGSNGGTGYDETQFGDGLYYRTVFLQTAGNRSMLANDFTQINDLGYGLVCNNGAFSEQVSTFSYYCHAAFYANNGSEIRSLNGSNGYGNFGLVAEGADPNEIPDQVTLEEKGVQAAKAFTNATYTNAFDEPSIYVTDMEFAPKASSLITIDHGGATGVLNYVVQTVTTISDQDNDNSYGEEGDVIVTGIEAVQIQPSADAARSAGTYEDVVPNGGTGSGATFDVVVAAGGGTTVTPVLPGSGYTQGDSITIPASRIGGNGSDVTFNVDVFGGTLGAGTFNNKVYKLDLRADDVLADDFFGTLQLAVPNGTLIEYRDNFNFVFDDVIDTNKLVTRPSTAINFDESDDTTYRSTAFSANDSLSQPLGANKILTTFEVGFDHIELIVDYANVGGGYGSAQGDTQLAIEAPTQASNITRLTRSISGKQPGDAGYEGGMIFAYAGKVHQIQSYNAGGAFVYITFTTLTNISNHVGAGLGAAFTESRSIFVGLQQESTAEITIAISLTRATGHDFTQIGTGSYNDTNYPNVILGDPENSLAEFYTDSPTATSGQVWERRKGRVFFVSTDQYGFFRVGKFFSVDQATGDITFAGEIGLSNANSLGFKRGVTINEFSADDSMVDESGTAVPTEKAIVSYVNRRLGFGSGGQIDPAPSGNRIGPGFLPLNGASEMEADLQMGANQITNLGLPGTDGTAAANKNYVDDKIKEFDQLADLRETEINSPASGDILVGTGKKRAVMSNPATGYTAGNTLTSGANTATVIDVETVTDNILGDQADSYEVAIVTFEYTAGTFADGDNVTNGSIVAELLEDPYDEFANASEATASDINFTVTRTAGKPTYNLQYEAGSLENADVSASAAIAQSKLAMRAADTNATAPASPDQTVLGLARFDSANFSASNGWVKIKDNGVALDEIAQVASGTVLGRTAANTGNVSAINFSDIVGDGGGLADSDFGTYGSETANQVLIRTAESTYGVTNIATGSTANTMVKRDNNGKIQAAGYIIGGDSNYEILSTAGTDLNLKTPGQAVILSAQGNSSSSLVVDMPGSLDIGSTGRTGEGDFQANSSYASEGFLSTDWVYTKFIQDEADTDSGGTGISLGDNTGFTSAAADTIILVAGGNEEIIVNDTQAQFKGNIQADAALTVEGATTLKGTVTLGNAAADLISVNGRFNTNLLPSTDNSVNIGQGGGTPLRIGTVHAVLFSGTATTARYADLAEKYTADENYEPGTVVVFGGEAEVTACSSKGQTTVAGVISTNPAYLMNSDLDGGVEVAIMGRVPCKVIGKVRKGDMLVTSAIPGYAIVNNSPGVGTVLGKAIGTKDSDERGIVEIAVGKV